MYVGVNVNLQDPNYIMSQEFLSGNWIIGAIWRLPSFKLNNKLRN